MKNMILVLIAVIVCGCAAIDGRRLEKDIANYTQTVDTICTTAELFSAVGKQIPGVEQCKHALKIAGLIQSRSDAFAVSDALRCVDKNDVKSVEFVECLAAVKWLPNFIDQINNAVDSE